MFLLRAAAVFFLLFFAAAPAGAQLRLESQAVEVGSALGYNPTLPPPAPSASSETLHLIAGAAVGGLLGFAGGYALGSTVEPPEDCHDCEVPLAQGFSVLLGVAFETISLPVGAHRTGASRTSLSRKLVESVVATALVTTIGVTREDSRLLFALPLAQIGAILLAERE